MCAFTLAMALHATTRAGGDRGLAGAVGRGIVGDPQRGPRQRPPQRRQRRGDHVGLVAGGDDDGEFGSTFRPQGRLLCRAFVAKVEAHITGTVWKIEVGVGDEVDEGDTVVILESMKMEMPVEAEDPGKVAEIRCEEGQSVSEGDVLVVLE